MSQDPEIMTLERAISVSKTDADEIDFSAFFAYLASKNGHEIATEVLTMLKTRMNQAGSVTKLAYIGDLVAKILLVAAILGCATWLSVEDKFTSTISLLMGTIIGFVFGKKSS